MTAAGTRIHHLALTTSDLEKAITFYVPLLSMLGYRNVLTSATLAAWELIGQPEILLYQAKGEAASRSHTLYQPGFHHLAFRVADRAIVDQIHTWLCDSGFAVLEAPRPYPDYPGNYYAVFFLDPDGLKLEIMTD
ncbi:VOC family protein [Devosia sp. RR2S18]|uniref:VOC family protein n=1 Tax=Devosia rhizosphaerae TaxID=3049774 RepID=UPI002540392A|nr:VOC family protein [Devosia sp. RR2S18]WIJ26448.1 VOC family protein [Devosia sp. RR2S18]